MPEPKRGEFSHASERAAEAGDKLQQVQLDVIKEQARFFEKLALLNGSALAFSVSVLGYFSARPNARVAFIIILHAAWGFLLMGLLGCIFRNLFHQGYRFFEVYSWFAEAARELKTVELETLGNGAIILDDSARRKLTVEEEREFRDVLRKKGDSFEGAKKQAERHSASYERAFKRCGYIGQVGLFLGLLLMVFFVVANTP
jgi:hypothetical protein